MRTQRRWVMGFGRLLYLPFPAVLAALLAACTGSPSTPTPTEPPDIRGSWSRGPFTWRWSERLTYDLLGHAGSARCEGSLVITSQDGSSFGGRYVIDNCGAEGSSGAVLDGHISADGQLSFRLLAREGWGPGLIPGWHPTDCPLSEDSGVYEGSFSGSSMTASRLQILSCAPGRVVVVADFEGVRQ